MVSSGRPRPMGLTIFAIFRSLPFRPPRGLDKTAPLRSWPLKTGRSGWQVSALLISFETELFPRFACLDSKLLHCSKTIMATFGLALTMRSSSTKMATSGVFRTLIINRWVWYSVLPRMSKEIFGRNAKALQGTTCPHPRFQGARGSSPRLKFRRAMPLRQTRRAEFGWAHTRVT